MKIRTSRGTSQIFEELKVQAQEVGKVDNWRISKYGFVIIGTWW